MYFNLKFYALNEKTSAESSLFSISSLLFVNDLVDIINSH